METAMNIRIYTNIKDNNYIKGTFSYNGSFKDFKEKWLNLRKKDMKLKILTQEESSNFLILTFEKNYYKIEKDFIELIKEE